MKPLLRILLVEDSPSDAELIVREIRDGGYDVEFERVETKAQMQDALSRAHWDMILSDDALPAFSSMQALAVLRASGQDIPLIVVSGTLGEEAAVAALRAGALDFLVKQNLARLVPAIERELREVEIRRSRREAESRYRALVERLPMIVYTNPASSRASTTYVSPQIESILGYSPEEWLADPEFWQTRIHPDDRETVLEEIERSKGKQQPVNIEYRMFDREGRIVWFEDQNILVRDERGQPAYWQGVKIDITRRKMAEGQILQLNTDLEQRVAERTQQLERALRAKDGFLASMSHELRTPLNAVLGLSESLAENTAGPLNEKQLRYVKTIRESGNHLLSLINDILDLARIEAGEIVLNVTEVSLSQICEASLRMVNELALKKEQEIVFELDPGIGTILVDERRLKQMLVNLLSNAVKFTPSGGRIGLQVRGDRLQKQVRFTVWDTGIGIQEDDLRRLFQPFVQLDSGLAREAAGTGLGLALVAQMAQRHGGSVSAESEPGLGSRFTLTLPWEPSLADDRDLRMKSTGKFRAIRPEARVRPIILLVEDTQETTVMVTDYLHMAGYHVLAAGDALSGIEEAKRSRPDLILMDIQLPGMDGLEATRRLRADPDFRSLPILAVTALAMPGDRERCLAAGATDYVTKPVSLRKLASMIDQYLLS